VSGKRGKIEQGNLSAMCSDVRRNVSDDLDWRKVRQQMSDDKSSKPGKPSEQPEKPQPPAPQGQPPVKPLDDETGGQGQPPGTPVGPGKSGGGG